MTATDYAAEHERLSELVLCLERAGESLEAVRRGIVEHDEQTERLADWQAVAAAGIACVPEEVEAAPLDALLQAYAPAWRLSHAATRIMELCRGTEDEDLQRYARGLRLVAHEVHRAFWRDEGLDVERVAALGRGLRILGHRMDARAIADTRAWLDHQRQLVRDYRAFSMTWAADAIERDPQCRRLMESLRAFAGELREGELY